MYHPKQYRTDIVSFDLLDRTIKAKGILFLNFLVMFIITPILWIYFFEHITAILGRFRLFILAILTLINMYLGSRGLPIKWILGEMQHKVGNVKISKHKVSINFQDKLYHFTKDNISELFMRYDYEKHLLHFRWNKGMNQKMAKVHITDRVMFEQFMKIRKVWKL